MLKKLCILVLSLPALSGLAQHQDVQLLNLADTDNINVVKEDRPHSESALKAKFLLEGGIEYGGDEFLTILFTDGEDQTMRAGQGGYLALGGQFEFSQALMLRTSIGIKYNTTAAENVNIRLTRFPINLMPYWKINEDFRLGAGISSHQSVKFRGDDFVPDVDFTSSVGPRFEFGYRWIALTYTSLQYRAETTEELSASSVGLAVSYAFPNK